MRIGVVTPAYNAAAWVGAAIASVLAQTHADWRLVVVDDGSTDATGDVIGQFVDPRIRLIRQANAGVSAARNRGLADVREAKPAALLFLDADDVLAPDALSRLAAALGAAPDAVAAVGAYTFAHTKRVRMPPAGRLLRRLLVRNLFVNGGHVLIRAASTGEFRTDIAYGEDWEYWIRLALQGPFAAATGRSPVLSVRQHETGAYRRLAADPGAFVPCMEAMFGNPDLVARLGAERLAAIRRHTEAENAWIIGRELIRHRRKADGLAWLRRSVTAHPGIKRLAMFGAALVVEWLPAGWRGPFRPY